ncbi:MAG TPA: hypothetical protein PLV64_18095 [Anaerolineales bacterium]|nr:hypothetical protein [Anaerolineales bacterium]
MKKEIIASIILILITLACGNANPTPPSIPETSVFDSSETAYGFYPSPPEISLESVFQTFKDMAIYGDFVLIQQNVDWESFISGVDGESQQRTDITNQIILARQNSLDYVFVLDPLNGLNRREFFGLPANWDPNFANPEIRAALKNYALWVARNFEPRYLALASEINTYMDAHPRDAQNFISLYNEIYALVKAEAPETQIFVTFQWDDLNNMFPQPEEGNRQRLSPNWEQVEAFEPNLDVWAISSYPYFIFPRGEDIPADYYSPLLERTSKPVAFAEGGFSTQAFAQFNHTPEDQVAYLNALHEQLGPRMVFWVNTLLNDFNIDSYAREMAGQGRNPEDAAALGNFAYIGLREFDGTPKPALEVWQSFRNPAP